MNKYEIISKIVTEMAKDDSIDINLIAEMMLLADKNDELFNYMLKWSKNSSKHDKSANIIAIQGIITDYYEFGDKMYGISE